ncbi:DUF952 domain-containing protein [Rubripirellula reticaptiva]|uniref:Dihydroorotate dehydrogenase n=1 Tax=Rubripirellula reticaptiva TaxID=2528013 RepID=A0A5C6EIN7_9BACT|nr:DUF952 domain-containing protein [Rubripirellula reticaptiva]TWU47119.1 hypothetical protein Poly59_60930 [Rubripirellula reticaptiva]
MASILFKVVPKPVWESATEAGFFAGHGIDLVDGFIHLSLPEQVAETLARHFVGQTELMLVTVDGEQLDEMLRFEPSRGGDLFPHVYGSIPMDAVIAAEPLMIGPDGLHVLPS